MNALEEASAQAETISQLLARATAALANARVGTPRLDAEVLLAAACGVDRTRLYMRAAEAVPPPCRARFGSMLARRMTRVPLQYVVGKQEFWSLNVHVTPDVLIPRPETELLVEIAVATLGSALPPGEKQGAGGNTTTDQGAHPHRVALCDLGTGSGCIAVALATELPQAEVWGLDVSAAALAVAALNAQRHAVADRMRFIESDLFAAVQGRQFDAIVCNPPYVPSADCERAQPELAWEPRQALDGGQAGLDVIRRVVAAAPQHLVPGGWLIMEIGADQGDAADALARAAGFDALSVRRDYAGLPRVLLAQR
jgi:release factor glutamine methyltransferase